MSDLMACSECRNFYLARAQILVAACASVGIEYGLTSGQALRIYIAGYHRDGHREPEPTERGRPRQTQSVNGSATTSAGLSSRPRPTEDDDAG